MPHTTARPTVTHMGSGADSRAAAHVPGFLPTLPGVVQRLSIPALRVDLLQGPCGLKHAPPALGVLYHRIGLPLLPQSE